MNHASGNDGPPRKPTLLFLQYGETRKLSDFMLLLRKHQVECLRLFFDVIIIQNDCDYQEICERYQPDLTMIEMLGGGVENSALRKPRVSNMSCCTEDTQDSLLECRFLVRSVFGLPLRYGPLGCASRLFHLHHRGRAYASLGKQPLRLAKFHRFKHL